MSYILPGGGTTTDKIAWAEAVADYGGRLENLFGLGYSYTGCRTESVCFRRGEESLEIPFDLARKLLEMQTLLVDRTQRLLQLQGLRGQAHGPCAEPEDET